MTLISISLTIILKFFRRYILFFIILGILLSFSFAVYASIEHKMFSFYMLPSRAWEILIGSFLGYLYYKKKFEFDINYSVYYFLYIGCLIIILLSFFFIDIERFRHPSFITLIPLIATSIIIFIESSKNKGCLKILNNKYLVFVGKISYSLYLWHFLLFAIYRNSYLEENLTTKILIIFLSFLFSILTYKYIENVFRNKKITSKKKFRTIGKFKKMV